MWINVPIQNEFFSDISISKITEAYLEHRGISMMGAYLGW